MSIYPKEAAPSSKEQVAFTFQDTHTYACMFDKTKTNEAGTGFNNVDLPAAKAGEFEGEFKMTR